MFHRAIWLIVFATFTVAKLCAQTATPSMLLTPAMQAPPASIDPVESPRSTASLTESWTALPLAKSGLPAELSGAVLLSKIDTPQFTRELLQAEWRHGDPIDLYVVRPQGVDHPPVILYLYNYTSDTERFRDDGWCRRATQNGFAAIGFVSALSGQRFHAPRPMKQWFVSELQEALATSTHDVQMVLNYLANRGDLNMDKVGMFGQESGGTIAILAASVDPRIKALDVIDPWGDWPVWLGSSQQIPGDEHKAYSTPDFLEKVATLDPVKYLPDLKVHSLRVQQVADNLITPPEARDKIASALPNPQHQLVRYRNVGELAAAWHTSGLSGWLRAQLQ